MNILVVFPSHIEAQNYTIPQSAHSISVDVSGVGVYNMVYNLTKMLTTQSYDILICAGIAGTFTREYSCGDVVRVSQDIFADIGVTENQSFLSLADMGLEKYDDFPFSKGWLPLSYECDDFHSVSGITVNQITTSEQKKQELIEMYNPGIESMEGAAAHYVSLREKVPCVHIRAISNKVGDRNKHNWCITQACESLHAAINRIISKIECNE
ncbi:MAG: futalosine hydrolase [Bacteroidales bacterium]|jgi:futalosine hydrolase|nr:futalosine hydrolase [Bacteroidales bacterium]